MIPIDRFIAPQRDFDRWLHEHNIGVSATAVSKAATPAGFTEYLATRDEEIIDNPYMAWGRYREPIIAREMQQYGVLPSDWLIAGENRLHRATADGLSLDHTLIGEIKTTGDGWDGAETNPKKIPIKYRRQVQWQLHVTGADRCLFMWELRATDNNGDFYSPWLDPRHTWIERDEDMISELVGTADRLLSLDGTF
jgi:hypothetical protein